MAGDNMSSVQLPTEWEEAADTIAYDSETNPPPIILLCGAANSGKSVFSRALLDTLVKRYGYVGYLDMDLGQPEFTPPGCLSLHIIDQKTPDLSILCLKTPARCFFYGDISPQKDVETYTAYSFDLYDHFIRTYYQTGEAYNPERPPLPLIINTSGWIRGAGYTLLVQMLSYTSPSHVVQLRVEEQRYNLPTGRFWLDGNPTRPNFIELNAAWKTPKNPLVPKHEVNRWQRDLRMIAYFRQCLPIEFDFSSSSDITSCLAVVPAYKANLKRIKVLHLRGQTPGKEGFNNLEGVLIGLGISNLASPSSGAPFCLGFGFVKKIDYLENIAYVITPVSHSILEKVDVILHGLVKIPIGLSQVDSVKKPSYGSFSL